MKKSEKEIVASEKEIIIEALEHFLDNLEVSCDLLYGDGWGEYELGHKILATKLDKTKKILEKIKKEI